MRVAGYLRVSSEEQAEGHSLDTQRDMLTAWAQREAWDLIETFEDPGLSGTDATHRPGFQRMIAAAEDRRFDAVLVLRYDRFARNTGDAALYRKRLDRAGVQLLSYSERTGDGPAGFLMRGMHELLAEYYSVELSHKTSLGWRKRAEKGLPVGDVPYGYRSTSSRSAPEIVEREAEAVRYLFEVYAGGGYSLQDLAEDLNALGFQMRTKAGAHPFGQKSVRGILGNPFYVGDIAYHGEVVGRGLHEPIVTRSLFEQAQAVLSARAYRPRALGTAHTRTYMLAGVGLCSCCSQGLWANTSKGGRRYYRCSSRRRGIACRDARRGARGDDVEQRMSGLFSDIVLPEDWQDLIFALAAEGGKAEEIAAQRERLERRLERAQRELLLGDVDAELARRVIRETRQALADLAPPDAAVLERGEWLLSIPELWPRMTAEERRDLVRASLDFVSVDLEAQDVVAFSPKKQLEPLFSAMLHAPAAPVAVCNWRPRSDSNRRSPP